MTHAVMLWAITITWNQLHQRESSDAPSVLTGGQLHKNFIASLISPSLTQPNGLRSGDGRERWLEVHHIFSLM